MVLIVDNTRRKFRAPLRERLLAADIPCCVATAQQAAELLPVSLVAVTVAFLFEDVRYLSELYTSAPVLLYEDTDTLYAYLVEALADHCGTRAERKIGRVTIREREICFYGKRIPLTRSEQRILTMLGYAPMASDTGEAVYYTSSQLAAFCMEKGRQAAGSIPVHIANINRKTTRAAGVPMIDNKRYCGYRIHQ